MSFKVRQNGSSPNVAMSTTTCYYDGYECSKHLHTTNCSRSR